MKNFKKKPEELKRISETEYKLFKKNSVIIVLDNIRSGHNVGSIFRTCDAFLAEKLFLCGITPVPPNQQILKTALGSARTVDWEYAENTLQLVNCLKEKGCIIFSVEQTQFSTHLSDIIVSPEKKYVLVFGHEIYGIEQDIINISDMCIEIPQSGTKHSLNVSVCAGIVLYHFTLAKN